jgi:hypothetical protein
VSTNLVKLASIKFHENLLSISQVVTCGQMDRHIDKVKLIGAFLNCVANAPGKNGAVNLKNISYV